MKKNYQTGAARAAMNEVVVPDAVSVAMSELTGAMREGLLALAVGAGLQVMQALMDESVTALAGPRGRHDPGRAGLRCVTAPRRARWCWVAVRCRCVDRGSVAWIAVPRWRWGRMSCSRQRSCSVSSRSSG